MPVRLVEPDLVVVAVFDGDRVGVTENDADRVLDFVTVAEKEMDLVREGVLDVVGDIDALREVEPVNEAVRV